MHSAIKYSKKYKKFVKSLPEYTYIFLLKNPYREGFKGRKCECKTNSKNNADLEKKCLDESGQTCGGRGNCQCGMCECDEGFLGPKCLQKLQDCPKHNGGK